MRAVKSAIWTSGEPLSFPALALSAITARWRAASRGIRSLILSLLIYFPLTITELIHRVKAGPEACHADANHQRVVARGGGHSWCGLAVRSGGMLIDLARLNKVTFEPGLMRATVQPFVSNRDVIAHLEPHGLAFPTGHCPQVKLSGYLLSGGIGWNSGFWGPACHSVEAIDVVTAKGELVRVSDYSHPELFWAARGGGAGFPGIAVCYHLRLYRMPETICESSWDNGVPGATDTAFSMTGKAYGGLWTMWSDSADDIANCQWHDKMMSILKPFAIGHYLGETDIVEDPGLAAKCFAKSHWLQLQRVRSELDPNGLFQGFEGGLRTFPSSV
jgi:FAD binding domain